MISVCQDVRSKQKPTNLPEILMRKLGITTGILLAWFINSS